MLRLFVGGVLCHPGGNMCGIIGIYDPEGKAAPKAALLLAKLQNRGPQGTGAVSIDEEGLLHEVRGPGLVEAVLGAPHILSSLRGSIVTGQVRYATFGETIQPLVGYWKGRRDQPIIVAHNGEFGNAISLRREAQERWQYQFQSTSDTEVILPFLEYARESDFKEALLDVVRRKIRGAFSLIIFFGGKFYCIRDRHGVRPLVVGRNKEGVVAIASEDSALRVLDVEDVRYVDAAELLVVAPDGIEEEICWAERDRKSCIFEHVYFANPDSDIEGINVSLARDRMGAIAFEEIGWRYDMDVLIPILDSGLHPTLGLHEALLDYAVLHGEKLVPLKAGVHRSWFVGRTFQEQEQATREILQRVKSSVIAAWVRGKRVWVGDDSLVRGTVTRAITALMRLAGAKEVHWIIFSPPTIGFCPYGVDTYQDELIAARLKDIDAVRNFIGADSLHHLSIDGLYRAVTEAVSPYVRTKEEFCAACFTGRYPIPFEQDRTEKPRPGENLTINDSR